MPDVPCKDLTAPQSPSAALAARADIKVGFACNNHCVFCAQGQKRTACKSIPLDVLRERLALARAQASTVVLTGGEPTLYKHLLALVRAARELGYTRVQIQTNGRMLSYATTLQGLVAAGANEFSPSLHSSTAEIHDALTGAPGSFRQSVEGILNVLRAHQSLVTNSVITRQNLADLPRLVQLLGRMGVRQAQLAFVHPVGTALEQFDTVVPRLPDVVAPLREARQIARRHGLRLMTEAIPWCFLPGMEDLCVEEMIPQTTVVDLNGRVESYSSWRVTEGKAHGPPCEICMMRPRCEGPWREYPEKHGWSEFLPITALPGNRILPP